jgi:hypothetical protein
MMKIPVEGEWMRYSSANIASDAFARAIGVYEIGNSEKRTVFIGSGDIRHKLQQHADPSQGRKFIPETDRVWFKMERTPFPYSREIQVLEEFKRDHGHLPKYNATTLNSIELFSLISKMS